MIDFNTIINNIDNNFIESENWKSFDNMNVFINYMMYVDEATKYTKRQNRILMEISEYWTSDITIELTNVIENNMIQYSQFKINNFVAKLENGSIIPITSKPRSPYSKIQEWEEKLEACQSFEMLLEDMRDKAINYCSDRQEKILQERIYEYGSIEVYESIIECKKKIKAIDNKIELLQEQEILDDKELVLLENERNTLNQSLQIAISEKITIADVTRRTFNISNIKKRVK